MIQGENKKGAKAALKKSESLFHKERIALVFKKVKRAIHSFFSSRIPLYLKSEYCRAIRSLCSFQKNNKSERAKSERAKVQKSKRSKEQKSKRAKEQKSKRAKSERAKERIPNLAVVSHFSLFLSVISCYSLFLSVVSHCLYFSTDPAPDLNQAH